MCWVRLAEETMKKLNKMGYNITTTEYICLVYSKSFSWKIYFYHLCHNFTMEAQNMLQNALGKITYLWQVKLKYKRDVILLLLYGP